MTKPKKLRVMVLYGGRSGEHEISLRSAASVIRHLDSDRFEVVPVAIDPQGRWLYTDFKQMDPSASSLTIPKDAPEVLFSPYPPLPEGASRKLLSAKGGESVGGGVAEVDVVFPVMHGPLCEDGTIQGLLELADVAYVGCGVLASSVCMDKEVAKRLVRDCGLPIVPYMTLKQGSWVKHLQETNSKIAKEWGYPVFVKPANLGSSVGVHKVRDAAQLETALRDAFQYDTKVLIEKAIDAREIECAVLENSDPAGQPLVSAPGEIVPTHEFYSYEAKYIDEAGARLLIPANMSPRQVLEAQKIAREAFEALECEGMARVDFFLDKQSGEFYFNEVNTIPGFTSISMYPKLWEYSGMSYSDLLTSLIDLATARHKRKTKLVRKYEDA